MANTFQTAAWKPGMGAPWGYSCGQTILNTGKFEGPARTLSSVPDQISFEEEYGGWFERGQITFDALGNAYIVLGQFGYPDGYMVSISPNGSTRYMIPFGEGLTMDAWSTVALDNPINPSYGFIHCKEGHVWAFDLEDESIMWVNTDQYDELGEYSYGGLVYHNGYIYKITSYDGWLMRYDAMVGECTYWQIPGADPYIEDSCVTFDTEGYLYTGDDSHIYKINPSGPSIVWQQSNEGVATHPAIDSAGNIYVTSYYNDPEIGWRNICLSYTKNGSLRWAVPTGGYYEYGIGSGIGLNEGIDRLYYELDSGYLCCHVMSTGQLIGETYIGDGGDHLFTWTGWQSKTVIGADNRIYCNIYEYGGPDPNSSYIVCINPDGSIRWKSQLMDNHVTNCSPAFDPWGRLWYPTYNPVNILIYS